MISTCIGWIGAVCFAFCGVPQAYQCYKVKHSRGLSGWFLGLWMAGEVCYVASILAQFGFIGWLMFNYILNFLCLLVIIRYKLFPRETSHE